MLTRAHDGGATVVRHHVDVDAAAALRLIQQHRRCGDVAVRRRRHERGASLVVDRVGQGAINVVALWRGLGRGVGCVGFAMRDLR